MDGLLLLIHLPVIYNIYSSIMTTFHFHLARTATILMAHRLSVIYLLNSRVAYI